MAIAKKPGMRPAVVSTSDAKAEEFIGGAGAKPVAALPSVEPPEPTKRGRVATMVRFDAILLDKVDAAAKRRGISRSAWIQYTLSEALEGQGG